MRWFLCTAILLLTQTLGVRSDVQILSDSNFTTATASGSHLIEFYAPWCTHCKALEPAYIAAAESIDSNTLQLSKVDCTVNTKVCKQHKIEGYPTILYKTENTPKPIEYKQGRNSEDFIKFSELLKQPAVHSVVTKQSINTLISDNSVVFILFNDNKYSPLFTQLAYQYHPSTTIKFATAPLNLLKQYIDTNTVNECIVAVSAGRTQYNSIRYSKNMDSSELTEFIKQNQLPLIAPLSADAFDLFTASNKYIVAVVLDFSTPAKQAQSQQYVNNLYALAQKYNENFVFTQINANEFGGYLKTYGIHTGYTLPYIYVVDYPIYYYNQEQLFDKDTVLTVEQVDNLLQQIETNKLSAQSLEPVYSPYRYTALFRYYYKRASTPVQYAMWAAVGLIGSYSAYLVGKNIYVTFKEEWNEADAVEKKQLNRPKQQPQKPSTVSDNKQDDATKVETKKTQ